MARVSWNYPLNEGPTVDSGPELISGAPTLIGGSATWDGSTLHLEGTNSSGTFEGAGVVDGGDYHVTFDYNTSAANTYIRIGGGGNLAIIPGPAIGTYDEVLSAQGTGYILNIASDNNQGDFTNFSVKSATGGDIIHNTDPSTQGNYQNLPIYDTDALMGNNARYIEIPQFTIPAGDDFEISFDWIRQDAGGLTSSSSYIVSDGTNENRLFINDTTNTSPSNVLLFADNVSQATFVGAMDDVAIGQHVSCKWTRAGNVHELFIDDASKGTIVGGTNTLTIDNFYGWASGFKVNTDSALQNVILENLTTGEAIGYKINEGSGFTVKAYTVVNGEITNTEVPASDGTIIE